MIVFGIKFYIIHGLKTSRKLVQLWYNRLHHSYNATDEFEFELESLSKAGFFYLSHRTSHSLVSEKFLQTHSCCDVANWYEVRIHGQTEQIVFSQIKRIGEKYLWHLFIISSSSDFFNKTNFKQYLFESTFWPKLGLMF